jgi:valyl-tRNA synthetase
MFGDTAVAVHPKDERYSAFVGKKVILPIANIEIPVIADDYPDPEKGTGAVKITPAHDPNDFEVGERHGLPKPICINTDATMNAMAGKYEGMDRYACRKALLKELDEKGYLIKIEDKEIAIGACYRCDTVIEPMLSDQWFVSMHDLAEPAIAKALSKELQHIPDRFEKTYLHWLTTIRDWCISRQLWWGHRIPAYYCQDCGELIVARVAPTVCAKCGSSHLKQDEDVLDTWFSSALWPFSTLGWPEKTADLDYFYPTDVLVTGYDIIFFWVVRMVFSGLEMTGELPFKYVYVHGLVRDAEGRKMSKSLGNGVDPLEIIDQYGADALRFMLMTGVSPGNDLKFQVDKVEASRNFANKLWNASRFVLMTLGEEKDIAAAMQVGQKPLAERGLRDEDKWMLSRLNDCVQELTSNLDKFDLSLAAQKIYELIWNTYCDWYIELVKARLYGSDEADQAVARFTLVTVLKDMLKMLHPFMPFITEEIWSYLPKEAASKDQSLSSKDKADFLMLADWPVYEKDHVFAEETVKMELVMALIRGIRNIRAEAEAAPSKKLKLIILSTGSELAQIKSGESHIRNLANIVDISYIEDKKQLPEEVMSSIINNVEFFIPLDDLLDYQAEFDRLTRESNKMKAEVQRINDKLANQGFIAKAPAAIVAEEKAKCLNYETMLAKISERLTMVSKKLGQQKP